MLDLEELIEDMEPIETVTRVRLCRDPKDDMFLELALAGQANFLITGDKDLLALERFSVTTIVTPIEYLER